jgi:hypothetical protein
MATKAVFPKNTDCLKSNAEYSAFIRYDDDSWGIRVESGYYSPPENWTVENVRAIGGGTYLTIRRD